MQHKQKEQQMVSCILRDARIITDAMVQKQRDAQQSQLVVSAVGDQYVTNARYVQINSGLEAKINVFAQMHPLSPDECDVYSGLVQRSPSGKVTVMHNHCMSEQGMVEGFRFSIHAKVIDFFTCQEISTQM
jgi:Fe-S cluster assembly scaffold protein SufB